MIYFEVTGTSITWLQGRKCIIYNLLVPSDAYGC